MRRMRMEIWLRSIRWRKRLDLFMAEVIMELEEEEAVKVKEHVDLDVNTDFGVSLDVGLHVEKITPKVIEKFIKDFNEDNLRLDDTFIPFKLRIRKPKKRAS